MAASCSRHFKTFSANTWERSHPTSKCTDQTFAISPGEGIKNTSLKQEKLKLDH